MDYESLIELAKQLNIPQLIIIGVMFWRFYSRLDKKIEKLDERLSKKIEDLDERLSKKIEDLDERLSKKIDKLDEKVTDIDRRVCRMEGALNNKDCCLLKDSRAKEKVE